MSPSKKSDGLSTSEMLACVMAAALTIGTVLVYHYGQYQREEGERAAEYEQCLALASASETPEQSAEHCNPEPEDETSAENLLGLPFEGWVAAFTALLFVSTTGLWAATNALGDRADKGLRHLERAYIFAGPTLNKGELPIGDLPADHVAGIFVAKNLGKTPGFLQEFYLRSVGVQNLGDIPSYPTAEKGHLVFSDEPIAASGSESGANIQRIARMALDQNADTLMYGYIRYRDIFGAAHTSRFCIVLSAEALRMDPPVIHYTLHGAPAWNEWD